MTGLLLSALLLPGASALYLYTVVWSVRASKQRVFSLPWLLLPLGGALIAGITLALSIPASPASPVSLRLLELLAHLCAIVLIWVIMSRIAPASRLPGTWLYAWNPLVLIELAVYANTAGVAICLLLLAVLLLIMATPSSSFTGIVQAFRRGGGGVDDGRGRLRRPPSPVVGMIREHLEQAGDASVPSQPDPAPAPTEQGRSFLVPRFGEIAALVLVGLALRINLMALLLAPLLLWFIVRQRRSLSAALMGFSWRALLVLVVFVLAYLPDWRGSETFLAITNGLRVLDFTDSPLSLVVAPTRSLFIFVAQQAHFPPLMQPTIAADMTVLATSLFLFSLLYLREMGRVCAGSDEAARQALVQRDAGAERVISGEAGRNEDRHQALTLESWSEEDRRTCPPKPCALESWGEKDRREAPARPLNRPLSLQGDYDVLFRSWVVVIVGYIVLAATVFVPGYIVWSVWVVALRRFDTVSVCVLLLSCSALLYYPLQWFVSASTGFLVPLCVFGVPLVYLMVYFWMLAGRMERKKVLK